MQATDHFTLTARAALRVDLTAEALAREAYAAARSLEPNARSRAISTAALALWEAGLGEEAQAALQVALAEAEERLAFDNSAAFAAPVEAVRCIIGRTAALELTSKIAQETVRHECMLSVLENELEKDKSSVSRDTIWLLEQSLLPYAKSEVCTRLAKLWILFGEEARAAELTEIAFDRGLTSSDIFGPGLTLSSLVNLRLKRAELPQALGLIDYYRKRNSDGGFSAMEIGLTWLNVAQRAIELGRIDEVREHVYAIPWPKFRLQCLAEIARADQLAGRVELAEQGFEAALADARTEADTPSYAALAQRMHTAGRTDQAAKLLADARAMLTKAEASQRDAWLREIGIAQMQMGAFGEAMSIARELPAEPNEAYSTQVEYSRKLFLALWGAGRDQDALAVLDGIANTTTRIRFIGEEARRLAEAPRSDRERAQLVEALVARVRATPDPVLIATVLARIVISGLCIPRDPATLHAWSMPPAISGAWTTPPLAAARDYVAALESDLLQNGLPLPSVRALRERPLICYAGGKLIEIDGLLNGWPHIYVLLHVAGRNLRLGGQASAWHKLNSEIPPELAQDAAVLEYALLFTSMLGDAAGRFRVVEDLSDIEALLPPGKVLPAVTIEPARIRGRTSDRIQLEVTILQGKQLSKARLELCSDGTLKMSDTALLLDSLPNDAEIYDSAGGFLRVVQSLQASRERIASEPATAAYEIGLAFATGFGAGGWATDESAANVWLRSAQERGRTSALRDVAHAFAGGQGAPHDPWLTLAWLSSARAAGDLDAAEEYGRALLQLQSPGLRDHGLQVLRDGERLEHAGCTYELGLAIHNGLPNLRANPEEGRKLFQKAYERGSGRGALQLGLILADATNVPRDPESALYWLERATQLGLNEAWYYLGILRANGFGDAKFPTAAEAYQQAAAAKIYAAQVVLALRARVGLDNGGTPDRESALRWSRSAAEVGHRYGGLLHAQLLLEGTAAEREQARSFYERALQLALPAPILRSFVDPGYLGTAPNKQPIQAAKVLDEWRQKMEAALAASFGAR